MKPSSEISLLPVTRHLLQWLLPHFLDARKAHSVLFGITNKRRSLLSTNSGQGKAIRFSPMRNCRFSAKEELVKIRKTERLRKGLRKVQPFSRPTGLEKSLRRGGKFARLVRSDRLERYRRRHGRTIWRGIVVSYLVGAVCFVNLLGTSWNKITKFELQQTVEYKDIIFLCII